MQIHKTQSMKQLEKDAHVAKLISRIRERTAKIEAYKSNLEEIEIIEEHVEVNKVQMVLFRVEGLGEGVAIEKADIDSGAMSRVDGYQALADMVDKNNDTIGC